MAPSVPSGANDDASVAVALSRRRRTAVWTLVVLATLLLLVAVLATWVNRQMLDNDSWTKTSREVIQDPAVQSALSVYVTNQLYDNVDVPATIAQRLPPRLDPLAAPAAAALRQPTTDTVKALLARPRTQKLFITASAVTHQKLVNVLENKTGAGISTGNGNVTIDLGPMIQNLGPDLGVPASALKKVPPNTGSITVLRSDQLGAAQTGVQVIRAASVWLAVLVAALFAAALYIAAGARRKTLRRIGWAFVLVGVVVLLVRRFVGNYVVDALAQPANREPARHVWLITSSTLGDIGRASVLYGVIVVLGAVLAGPTRVATAVRRALAPVLNEKPWVAWGTAAFAYLLLILWGGTHALRTWQGILILGGLLAIGVAALRRQTLAEFRHPRSERPTASLLARRIATAMSSQTREPDATTPASAGAPRLDEELARLTALHDSGALTDVEFVRAKNQALS
jgi:hypothetical protein